MRSTRASLAVGRVSDSTCTVRMGTKFGHNFSDNESPSTSHGSDVRKVNPRRISEHEANLRRFQYGDGDFCPYQAYIGHPHSSLAARARTALSGAADSNQIIEVQNPCSVRGR